MPYCFRGMSVLTTTFHSLQFIYFSLRRVWFVVQWQACLPLQHHFILLSSSNNNRIRLPGLCSHIHWINHHLILSTVTRCIAALQNLGQLFIPPGNQTIRSPTVYKHPYRNNQLLHRRISPSLVSIYIHPWRMITLRFLFHKKCHNQPSPRIQGDTYTTDRSSPSSLPCSPYLIWGPTKSWRKCPLI